MSATPSADRPGRDGALGLRAGYVAVANLRYTPMEPVDLLARATTALRTARADLQGPWIRASDH